MKFKKLKEGDILEETLTIQEKILKYKLFSRNTENIYDECEKILLDEVEKQTKQRRKVKYQKISMMIRSIFKPSIWTSEFEVSTRRYRKFNKKKYKVLRKMSDAEIVDRLKKYHYVDMFFNYNGKIFSIDIELI